MVDLEAMFSDADRARIAKAVTEAESKTSAEIVPAVAAASGRYDRAEDLFGFWLAALTACVVWWVWPRETDTGAWGGAGGWTLLALVAGMALAFSLGAVVASRVRWIRRLLTPRVQQEDEVAARAAVVFFDRRVHHTRDGSGLLFYLSLEERMARVCADEAVTAALGQAGIDELRTLLVETTREHGPAEALCRATEEAGSRLADKLPRAGDDQNELADALVLLPAP